MGLDDVVEIEAVLKTGRNSTVYKAWHKRLQKHVAVKEVKHTEKTDTEIKRSEADALKNIKSPYTPQVYDFLSEKSLSFTILEYIRGESLAKLLERKECLTEERVVKWYKQLAFAMETIHKQNVYHRDIKPSNIMLSAEDDVCLIDFNFALVGTCGVRQCCRSVGYTSPEQQKLFKDYENILESQSKQGLPPQLIDWRRSDIYSLGATMLHLLTGNHPSEQVCEAAKLYQKEGGITARPLILHLINKSMQQSPGKRYADAKQISDEISSMSRAAWSKKDSS